MRDLSCSYLFALPSDNEEGIAKLDRLCKNDIGWAELARRLALLLHPNDDAESDNEGEDWNVVEATINKAALWIGNDGSIPLGDRKPSYVWIVDDD